LQATAAAPKVAAKKVGAKKSKFVLDLAVPVTDKLLTTKDVVSAARGSVGRPRSHVVRASRQLTSSGAAWPSRSVVRRWPT